MIKIRLEKWEKAIVMQVLEMDEDLRSIGSIYKNDKMELRSRLQPQLLRLEIYLRGSTQKEDFNVCYRNFESNEDRDKYYNYAVQLFNDYNNRDKPEENNIFVLE